MAAAPDDPIERLFDHCGWVSERWWLLRALFPDARLDLLNRRTGYVLAHLQDTLRDAVLLGIARLLDPPEMRGRRPLSFEGLIRELPLAADDPRRLELDRRLREFRTLCRPILEERHQRIAHTSRAVALGDELPGIPTAVMEAAITQVDELFDHIYRAAGRGGARCMPIHHLSGWEVEQFFRVIEAGNAELDRLKRP